MKLCYCAAQLSLKGLLSFVPAVANFPRKDYEVVLLRSTTFFERIIKFCACCGQLSPEGL
jgi:hypothetical protein